jgi:hypothetical protein
VRLVGLLIYTLQYDARCVQSQRGYQLTQEHILTKQDITALMDSPDRLLKQFYVCAFPRFSVGSYEKTRSTTERGHYLPLLPYAIHEKWLSSYATTYRLMSNLDNKTSVFK